MKYMVMTTKHHEGFLLWDSRMTDYNAARRSPGRDLVREYVEAAREFGLRVGFYYSLMDWHHPDGTICATDEAARRRFLDFTQGCVRELMSNYGKIDVLWYDVSWPLTSPHAWESYKMNAMVRRLQPHIIINNRSQLAEDLGTPEEHIKPEGPGRDWEACMTFNGSWGWQPAPPEDWHSVRSVLNMLRTCTAGGGNLLLNIGPKPDGSVPTEATERLTAVGRWLKEHGDIIYGRADRVVSMANIPIGSWTRKGKTFHFWCTRWPGDTIPIGGLSGKLASARLHGSRRNLPFQQVGNRLFIRGLPKACPDKIAHVAVLDLKFRTMPSQNLSLGGGKGAISPIEKFATRWHSPHVMKWQLSRLFPKGKDVSSARPVKLSAKLGWHKVSVVSPPEGFVNIHDEMGDADGIVYFADRFRVPKAGAWTIHLGHDGGAKMFVDGRAVLLNPKRVNPCLPGRSKATVRLSRGMHEIAVALDTDHGWGWGIFLCFEVPKDQRPRAGKPVFPILAE